MSNTQEHRFSAFANRRHAQIGLRASSPVPEYDYHRLIAYQKQCDGSGEPALILLSYVIRHKLMTLKPVKNLYSADMVTGGRQFQYAIDKGPVQDGLLVHRARWGQSTGIIPAYSILGATLIGMRAGQRAPLLCENSSVRSVSVLRVIQTT
ncbi:hypothetical protein QO034_21555 [Sedimentitalea sp. JM2-8]|uniref:Transcription elongation factor GreA/GreB C-terminal domain-containing protein n=1 Tax=Sedimentitalea xiamensis TaxID=3050037 RepID=A0ABT7FKN3_9RHOB|nr:hypothetical protein [Sedimentitalea xiamensis]MDK3075657.1 hypothetical protein [Sedimentitalea xiamensis]